MVPDGTADPLSIPWANKKSSGTLIPPKDHLRSATGEQPHPGNRIEWWFVHGSFNGLKCGRRFFMANLFRYEKSHPEPADHEGYYLLLSVLDPKTGNNEFTSRGEREGIERILSSKGDRHTTNLDPALMETYINELSSFGPPSAISLEEKPVFISYDPFSIVWKDYSFCEELGSFRVTFLEPGTDRNCRFTLTHTSPRHFMEGVGATAGQPISYVTRPRLQLSGFFGDEEVEGTAWFDHQWGNSGWFLSQPEGGRVHGWDWIRVNGDDGSDWIFLTFHDRKTETVLGRFAFVFKEGGITQAFRHFDTKTTRFWESGKTKIRYPVAMDIEIPEISARFSIQPVTDDQEIQVLGFMRAIWEGAAIVSGTIGNSPFSGTAHLELHGYGYIFDFPQYVQSYIDQIKSCIESFFPRYFTDADYRRFTDPPHWVHDISACNETLARPCWDLMSREKKYWRPVFGLLLLETLGVRSEKYKMLLSVVPELTHTGTLIIDDIEDDDWLRRGDICIHRRYGTDVAINAANTLYFLPLPLIAEHPDLTDKQRLDFYRIQHDSLIRGHFGQAQDIYWTKNLTPENLANWRQNQIKEKLLQMYEFKTASAAIASAEAGCTLAEADRAVHDVCISYARALGVAFQITDDIQSFEPPEGCGIVPGEDLKAGKLTYIIVRALELLDQTDHDRLVEILCTRTLRKDPAILREGCALIQKSGSFEACRTEAISMVDEAWQVFSEKIPPSEPKIMLRLFSHNLVNQTGPG